MADSNDFFTQVDIEGVVEDHAKQVVNLQEEQAREIAKSYEEVRKELIDRLSKLKANSFTAQHLRVVLAQIDAAIDAVNEKIDHRINAGAHKTAVMSIEQLVKEIRRFDKHFTGVVRPINIDVVKTAINTKEFLMNQYKDSLKAYSSDVKRDIARALTQSAIAELTYSEVVHKLGQYMHGKEWELHRIARTELHHIYSVAKLNGMKELKKDSVPDLMKALFHPMDTRTGEDSIELADENPILPLTESFEQYYTPRLKSGKKGKTQHYVFMTPPNRPNDRAILIPFRPEWQDSIPRREGPLT